MKPILGEPDASGPSGSAYRNGMLAADRAYLGLCPFCGEPPDDEERGICRACLGDDA